MGTNTPDRGLRVTRGRLPSDAWIRLTGKSYLPVLEGSAPLSRLMLRKIHVADHRQEVGALLATSRRTAWIMDGRRAARGVVKGCLWCRRHEVSRLQQRMGLLDEDLLKMVRPFQVVGLDLMGPLVTLRQMGRRSEKKKCWVAVYVCLASRAVACWLMPDYSTKAMEVAHTAHTSIYGTPTTVTTDQGTQLKAAAAQMQDLNWNTLQHKTAKAGTTWRFVPPGTPWRNGSAERIIGLLKRTMGSQIQAGSLLEELDLQSFLHRVSSIMNDRPLSARVFSVSDFCAITPKDLLLGAAPSLPKETEWQVGTEEDLEGRFGERMAAVERKVQDWWRMFSADVFPMLVPFRKWADTASSLDLGAVVLVQYASKYSKDRFRLGRVMALHPGRDGLVRTVTVGLRNLQRGAGELASQNRAGLNLIQLPVQRLVMVLPGCEQPKEIVDQLRRQQAPVDTPVVPQPSGAPRVRVRNQAQDDIIDL